MSPCLRWTWKSAGDATEIVVMVRRVRVSKSWRESCWGSTAVQVERKETPQDGLSDEFCGVSSRRAITWPWFSIIACWFSLVQFSSSLLSTTTHCRRPLHIHDGRRPSPPPPHTYTLNMVNAGSINVASLSLAFVFAGVEL